MSNRGVVYDLGYTPYEGDHLGRRGAIRSTYRDGIYRVLGIKRRARKKILPWTLAAFAVLPAIVFVGFAFLLTTFSPDAESPFGSHADYFELTGTVVLLFVALAAPELLIPDRREGVLSIYSSRPLLPDDYVGARFVSLLTVIAGFMLIPQVLMYVGFAALDADGFFSTLWSNGGDIPRILASTAVYAVAYAPIALLVATPSPTANLQPPASFSAACCWSRPCWSSKGCRPMSPIWDGVSSCTWASPPPSCPS